VPRSYGEEIAGDVPVNCLGQAYKGGRGRKKRYGF